VLAWMSRRANVNVRVFLEGKERILDRAMYKMKLLAAEDSDSSEDERQRQDSKRYGSRFCMRKWPGYGTGSAVKIAVVPFLYNVYHKFGWPLIKISR